VTLYGDNDPPADDRPTVQVTAVQWPVEELEPASLQRDGKRPRRTRILIAAGIATAVLASVAGVGAFAYVGDVPRGTTVLGTELGGRSQADATRELRTALERQASELNAPLPVRVGERTAELVPAEVGLQVDVDATVTAAMQTQAHVVDRLVGSRTVRPVVTVDEERLDAALKEVLGDQGRKMTMPGITWDGLTPKAIHPQPSLGLDPKASTQAVREGWLSNGPVTIPLAETHAVTTAEEVDRMVAELAKPAVAHSTEGNREEPAVHRGQGRHVGRGSGRQAAPHRARRRPGQGRGNPEERQNDALRRQTQDHCQ